VATFEEIEAEHGEALGVLYAYASADDVRAAVVAELQRGIDDGEGLDGRGLEMVQAMLELPGEHYTDGECLDLIGIVLDAWRELDL
jgi:hypothetical protein